VTRFDVFQMAERIEMINAAIYGAVAKQFAGDERARALFARLEAEELQHASRVRLLATQYRTDRKLLERFPGTAELEGCLRLAEDALAEAQAGVLGTELSAVKARLADLEARLSRAHAQSIAQDGHPGLRDFFRKLALQDEAHVGLLAP
jgi:hypothetical protein